MPPLRRHIRDALAHQSRQGLLRQAPQIRYCEDLRYQANGEEMLSFCSNDFLGYAATPLSSQSQRAGSGASRLIHGSYQAIRDLESKFAEKLGYPDAILCCSGYQANIAGLAQLPLPEGSRIYSDQLNHASIIDGLRLHHSSAQILPHLKPPPKGENWWVLESRYSMDGDSPQRSSLQSHQAQGGFLYLDEAHYFGTQSQEISMAKGLPVLPELANYPLGKAFGMQGSILAGTVEIIQWIRQFARAYIYTTAPSPIQVALIQERFEAFFGADGQHRREKLQANIALTAKSLSIPLNSPILSLKMGDNHRALEASRVLSLQGIHVQAIRPPTVPEGSARLRISLSALHRPADIQKLADIVHQQGWIQA